MTNDRTQWHRLAGLVLQPLFKRLGYETEIEVDLALKKQLVDIITVQKVQDQINFSALPKIYWEAFSDLNEHNLLSFKSYSESFEGQALEEFYGHLTNYKKTRKVSWGKINLYALSHRYPRKLFKPFEGTDFLETIKEDEIFDLKLRPLKKVRFVIMRKTDNPLLALFSGDPQKVTESYHQLAEQEALLADVSVYFTKIAKYHGLEAPNMYTKEDFLRDNPPPHDPFVLLRAAHEELLRRAVKKAEQKAKKKAEQARREAEFETQKREKIGTLKGKISALKAFYERGIISEEMYHSELPPLERELDELEP